MGASVPAAVEQGDALALPDELAEHRQGVLATALEDCGLPDREIAEQGLLAFSQWFFALADAGPGERLVMLKGPIDQMWHALILHTRLYRDLCDRHLGFFLEHQPQPGLPPRAWVADTLRILTRRYGGDLHPYFDDWLTGPSSPYLTQE